MVCLMLVAACGGGDGSIEADAGADAVAADAGNPIGGTYRLAWNCTAGCDLRPPMVGSVSLTVANGLLSYDFGIGAPMRHEILTVTDECLGIDGPSAEGDFQRSAYRLCVTTQPGVARAEIEWVWNSSPGGSTAWNFAAVPQ